MTPDPQVQELKARVDLVALFQSCGVELKKSGQNWLCRCPFHDDREASLSVNPDKQLFNCFGCEAGGDALEFLQLKEKLSFPQALQRLKEVAGELPRAAAIAKKPGPEDPLPGNLTRDNLLGRVLERYITRFRECPEAQRYLTERGLGSRELWDVFRIGYADGSLAATLPRNGPSRDALAQLGVLNTKGKEHFAGCLVVPLEHPDEGLLGFYGRRIDANAPFSHVYLPGPKRGVLQWQCLKQARRVWLAESVLDALSLWMAGVRDVTCLFGAASLHGDLEALLGRFGTPEVVFCLDGDRAGQSATERHAERLSERGVRCLEAAMPMGKDPNQLLQEEGAEALRERVSQFRPVQLVAPEPVQQEPASERREDGFVLRLAGVTYQATMIPPFVGRLRCALVASAGSRLYSEKLDLHSQRQRSLNAGQLVRMLEISRAEAERHLSLLLRSALEWVDEQKASEGKPTRRQAPELTDQERGEALAYLSRPDLAQAILADSEALGFVGEERAKLLAYLIGLSRKLPNPLSGVVISQSGAGKSTLAEMLEQLTPPEDVLFYSRITPQALYYMSHDLKGLLLLLEERAGGEAADYSIRTLQSRKKLRLAIPVKDPMTGKTTTQDIEVEGPVAYLETTTNPHLNPENASRCFELFMDESAEQTRRIHAQQRRNRMLLDFDPVAAADAIRGRHHNVQRMLKPMRVVIPYADRLTFPSEWLRTRRDNERFLCLIEAIAFLHQHQREQGEVDGKPYVLATPDDYRLAYELARDVLASTLHELTREAQALWEQLVPWVLQRAPGNPLGLVFTFKDLRELTTSLSNHRLRTAMTELAEMEYVQRVSGQNGTKFEFQLLTTDVKATPALSGLLHPDVLADGESAAGDRAKRKTSRRE